ADGREHDPGDRHAAAGLRAAGILDALERTMPEDDRDDARDDPAPEEEARDQRRDGQPAGARPGRRHESGSPRRGVRGAGVDRARRRTAPPRRRRRRQTHSPATTPAMIEPISPGFPPTHHPPLSTPPTLPPPLPLL